MKTIEVTDIPTYIENAPKNMNILFIGDTGVGKTTVIEKYCKDNDIFLKTLILSQLEASESLGIPVRDTYEYEGKTYNVLDTALPLWVFELAQHKKAMLFLDEFLCAQPSVMNSFLNFLSQKRVKGIDLSHVQVVAATNIGTYTFEPDSNMISRFCMFYVVNTTANKFISDPRIINNYKDENTRDDAIFEPRSLKPRCQQLLAGVKTEYLNDYYQGFTNKDYIVVHRFDEINDVIAPYFTFEGFGECSISDSNIVNLIAIMKSKFSKFRKWDNVWANFVNVDVSVISKIKEGIEGV